MSKHRKEVSQVSNEMREEIIRSELAEEIIRNRAYQLFAERGYEHGHDVDDWLQAEAEVMGKKPAARADLSTTMHKTAAA
jgi:hypothetical protein